VSVGRGKQNNCFEVTYEPYGDGVGPFATRRALPTQAARDSSSLGERYRSVQSLDLARVCQGAIVHVTKLCADRNESVWRSQRNCLATVTKLFGSTPESRPSPRPNIATREWPPDRATPKTTTRERSIEIARPHRRTYARPRNGLLSVARNWLERKV